MNRKILRPLANKVKAAQNSANRFENKKPPRTWIPSGASQAYGSKLALEY